ncbi:MAG: family 43 glycosylhydrolase [Firmicutes bacterium]|nr:family 43 glycosylhydrolase [Bacillota bacterium]
MFLQSSAIQIRDPFILPVEREGLYYLYGTTDPNCWGEQAVGFDAYTSKDLQEWEGPIPVFRPEPGFWADRNFWAPEVFSYNGGYYMLASFKAEGVCRGTQILVAETPAGPFTPHSQGPVTPRDWECLDGTLHLDRQGDSWLVFCREWVQIVDGEIWAQRLDRNLQRTVGVPVLLFKASTAPWSRPLRRRFDGVEKDGFVTDGPFLYQTAGRELLMLWSSWGEEGYALGIARSADGKILGPWRHEAEPLYKQDGGHGMVFTTFDGRLMLTLHSPNRTPEERPRFFPLTENNGRLKIG